MEKSRRRDKETAIEERDVEEGGERERGMERDWKRR